MEGYTTPYWSLLEDKFVTNFYSILSDEKRQDASTTAANIRRLLFDLSMRKDVKWENLEVIVSIVYGCDAQYRSGSFCYELCQLAAEFGIVYNRIIQASGHGKCFVDSHNERRSHDRSGSWACAVS